MYTKNDLKAFGLLTLFAILNLVSVIFMLLFVPGSVFVYFVIGSTVVNFLAFIIVLIIGVWTGIRDEENPYEKM